MPTDIQGSGNKIYLVHDGTKLTPQTDVEFKTVNDSTREVYEQDYLAYHREYHDIVVKTVREALDEVKFDTPFHRAMKRTRRLVPLVTENSAKDIEEKPAPVLVARKPRLKT